MKIHLRQRQHSKDGSISLYLELYKGTTTTANGKITALRDYEYLDLYLIDKPRNPIDKQHNKDTLKLAESIKAKRELEIKEGKFGFTSDFKHNSNFIDYFKAQKEKRQNFDNWQSTLQHLIKFAGTQITFREIDKKFCERFVQYLIDEVKTNKDKNLYSSSIERYFSVFKTCLNKAVDEEILLKNPAKKVSTPGVVENEREYLILDELKKLVKTECKYEFLKRAFLFACLTGLRWSDVAKLKWVEVQKNRIVFHQKKTKGLQYLDISDQAREYLGAAGKPDERIFPDLKYTSYTTEILQQWIKAAGITKHITFHCARHTNAILLLTSGVDIYTVSKLLGHAELKTTQIYAKIVDEKKREAVNKIPAINI